MASNGTPYNIKADWQELYGYGKTGVFSTVVDPIAEEIKNAEQQAVYLLSQPVIPFMDQGEATLKLLNRLAKLSPTLAGCITAKKHFTVGGQFEAITKKIRGVCRPADQEAVLDTTTAAAFWEWVQSWTDPGQMYATFNAHADNFLKFGNGFVEVVLSNASGEKKVAIHNHDMDRCLYLATPDHLDRVVMVSPYWYAPGNYGQSPQAVPLYPNFIQDETGSLRTMIHTKNMVSGRDWYGEPSWLACLYHAYGELQAGQYNVEEFANKFVGQVFFETYEDYDPAGEMDSQEALGDDDGDSYASGAEGFVQKMVQFFTNKGTRKRSWMHRAAGPEAKTTYIHQFKPMTDHDYLRTSAQVAETQVIKANEWHPALLGIQVPGQLGRNTEFGEALKAKYSTVIKPLQDILTDPINLVMKIAADYLGTGTEFLDSVSISYKNIYQDMLETESQNPAQAGEKNTPIEEPGVGQENIETNGNN